MFRVAITRAALVLLLASAGVGAAEAQTAQAIIPPDARRTTQCAAGLFTLTGTASFHVTLDDYSSREAVFVVMRFINPQGLVVKSKTVSIGPGGSATLELRGSGLYRVRADAFESSSTDSSGDTNLLASLYVSYDVTPSDGTDRGMYIGPPIWCDAVNAQVQ